MFETIVRLVVLGCTFGVTESSLGFRGGGLYWFHVIADNDLLPPEADVTSAHDARNVRECAKQCSNGLGCSSFFFNKMQRKCLLDQNVYTQSTPSFYASNGWRYFRVKTDSCKAEHGYIIDYVSRTCFRVVTSPTMTWLAARATCHDNNEMLAVLEPVEKAAFIHEFVTNNFGSITTLKFSIGASRPLNNWGQAFSSGKSDFTWLTGQLVNLTATRPYWDRNKPSLTQQDLNVVRLDGSVDFAWDDGRDYREIGYICERPLN